MSQRAAAASVAAAAHAGSLALLAGAAAAASGMNSGGGTSVALVALPPVPPRALLQPQDLRGAPPARLHVLGKGAPVIVGGQRRRPATVEHAPHLLAALAGGRADASGFRALERAEGRSREPPVGNLELAAHGEEQVGRLQISVHEPNAVGVREGGDQLGGDVLPVHGLKQTTGDRVVQVRREQLEDQVDVAPVRRGQHLQHGDHVGALAQLAKRQRLAHGARGIRAVAECVRLALERNVEACVWGPRARASVPAVDANEMSGGNGPSMVVSD